LPDLPALRPAGGAGRASRLESQASFGSFGTRHRAHGHAATRHRASTRRNPYRAATRPAAPDLNRPATRAIAARPDVSQFQEQTMRSPFAPAVLLAGTALSVQPAHAHGVAGAHMFVSTLIIDDPNMADEASLPTFSYLPQPSGDSGTPALSVLNFEFDKRITDNFGFSLNSGYQWLRQPGMKTANGWQNLSVGLKYKVYVNPEHEFMLSLGVERDFARTGANGTNGAALDNDDSSSTTPRLFFGKGLGDLPIGWLRPLAVTGELGYRIADKKLKVDPADGSPLNNGGPNLWTGGLSVQYSIRYLQSQVKDLGLPEFVNRLTPLVEVAWSSPASRPNNTATQYLFAAGLNYTATDYAVSLEMLIPGNRQTGSHLGVIAQLHLYFDDLLPNSLGKPIARWWE
jgi:hypothetical protein